MNTNEAASSHKLDEILQEESDRESNHSFLSPKRPQTADSIYGRQYHLNIETSNSDSKKPREKELNDENSQQGEEVEVDSELKTNFYKKYRTQNIRQKKSSTTRGNNTTTSHLGSDLLNIRPHSASNLRTNLKQTINKNNNNNILSSASNSNLNSNPIGELYELSKNYQSLDKTKQQASHQNPNKGSGSVYSSTSSSSSSRLSSNNLQTYEDELIAAAAQAAGGHHLQQTNLSFSMYKSLQTKKPYDSTSSDYDIENETPIKLDCSNTNSYNGNRKETAVSNNARKSQPILRTATSVINGNNFTNVTPTSSIVAFSHSSLPRSRSGSRSHTPNELIVTRKSTSGHNANLENNNNASVGLSSPRSKITSQYIPLSNSISAVASSAKSQLLQKKKAFY